MGQNSNNSGNNQDQGERIDMEAFESNLTAGGEGEREEDMNFHDHQEYEESNDFSQDFDGAGQMSDIEDGDADESDFDFESSSFMEDEDESEEDEEIDFEETENSNDQNQDDDADDDDDENEELKALNKALDKNYSSLEEAKRELLNKEKSQNSQEEDEEYNRNKNRIGYLNTMLSYKDEDLIREERELRFKNSPENRNKNLTEEELEEMNFEIDQEIENMKDHGTLRMNADSVRNQIRTGLQSIQSKNDAIDQKRSAASAQAEEQKIQALENEFADIYKQNSFFGVNLDKEVIKNAYKKVRQKNYFEEIANNPKQAARVALMMELESKIAKQSSNPTPAEVAKSIVNSKGLNRKARNASAATRSGASAAKGSSISSGKGSLVEQWLQ